MANSQEAFFEATSKGDLASIDSLLASESVDLPSLRDQNLYTPLHFACLSGNEVMAAYFLKYMKEKHPSDLLIWVNLPNNEDFTPICFACFRGNLVKFTQYLVRELVKYGASLALSNARQLQLMHVASQGNQPAVIAFLTEQGFDVSPKDVKGGTPLHWAAFMGCELAASLLLALKAPVNEQDLQGQTPLHLAALAGQVKIARCLLIKGADRQLEVPLKQNSLGRTALAVAHDRKHESLYSILQPPGCLAECSLRPPLRPYKRAYCIMTAYLFLMLLGTILNVFLGLKSNLKTGLSQLLQWAYLLASLLSVLFFAVVSLKDPGFVPKSTTPLTELYAQARMEDVCPDCMSLRPPRARHCQSCSRCVRKFDHHCPWLSNCIGAGNHGWFYLFLVFTAASLGISIYMNLQVCLHGASGSLFPLELFYLRITAAVIFSISAFFVVPLTFLLFVQTQNICLNRTTNERFARQTGSFRPVSSFADSMSSAQLVNRSNPFLNCYRMCCDVDDGVELHSANYNHLPARPF